MKRKKILAGLLAAAIVMSCSALPVFAAQGTTAEEENCVYSWPWQETQYVLMNIPYDEFYAAEVRNPVEVDGVSSATLSKTLAGTLAGGSYHVDAGGSDITGVIFPVKVTADELEGLKQVTDADAVEITVTLKGNTTSTTYAGPEALFQNESYAYYPLDNVPAAYKELRVNADGSYSFSAVRSAVTALDGVTAVLKTETKRGDYEIDLEGLTLDTAASPVSGVVLKTREGMSYGLRHVENIWRGNELAFCTGFTTEIKGSATSSAHYESIMGKTITQIVYYTRDGVYTIDTELYIPVKAADGSVLPQQPQTLWQKLRDSVRTLLG